MTESQQRTGYFMGQSEEKLCYYKIEFAEKLACGDQQTHEKAIALLKSWLIAQEQVAEEDLKKIWNGLFYCLGHAGKQSVQAGLIKEIVSLLENMDTKLCQQYFKAFLLTLRQEWPSISHLQLHKFYSLLKQFLRQMFIVLNNSGWDCQLTKGFMKDLTEQTFLSVDNSVAQAMNFYIADVYLSELQDFLPLQVENFVRLMKPFFAVLAKASDESLLCRVKGSVFDFLLENGRNLLNLKQQGKYIDEKLQILGAIVLTMGTTSRLFKLAATTTTLQANRRVLFKLHQEFSQLDGLLIKSEVSLHSLEANKTNSDNNLCRDKSAEVRNFTSQELQDPARGKPKKTRKISITENKVEGSQNIVKKLGEKGRPRKAKKVSITEKKPEGGQSKLKKLGEKGKQRRTKKVSVIENIAEVSQSRVKIWGEKVKPTKAKKISNGVDDGSYKEQSNAKKGSELNISQLQSKKPEEIVEEAAFNNTGFVQEAVKEGEILNLESHQDPLELDDSVISNLEKQFEKVATEFEQCSSPLPSLVLSVSPLSSGSQKRKRVLSALKATAPYLSSSEDKENEEGAVAVLCKTTSGSKISGEKGVKKVTFALKNNLVWRPSTPLPPHSLRVPPSATPRGSALKKGVSPGPVCIIKQSPSPRQSVSRRRCTMARKSPKKSKGASPKTQLLWRER